MAPKKYFCVKDRSSDRSSESMASKLLDLFIDLEGTQLRTVTVANDTKIHDILVELHEDGKGLVTLLRGVQRLQPEMTVGEAGLKHRDKLTLLWSKKYYEQATLRGMNWGKRSEFRDLAGSVYVKIPDNVDRIEELKKQKSSGSFDA